MIRQKIGAFFFVISVLFATYALGLRGRRLFDAEVWGWIALACFVVGLPMMLWKSEE